MNPITNPNPIFSHPTRDIIIYETIADRENTHYILFVVWCYCYYYYYYYYYYYCHV
jgi:hypothetical protein